MRHASALRFSTAKRRARVSPSFRKSFLFIVGAVFLVACALVPSANTQCQNIAGNWNYSESGTVTLDLTASDGETAHETDPVSGTGTVSVSQTGPCTFQYIPIPLKGSSLLDQNLTPQQLASLARTVTVTGNNASETGTFVVVDLAKAQQNGLTITSINPNVYTASGPLVNFVNDTTVITLNGTGNTVVTGFLTTNGQNISFTLTITASTTATLTASTGLTAYLLSVSTSGGGNVSSIDGFINCGFTCSSNYVAGTTVYLVPSPAQGWTFSSWSGCDSLNGATCILNVNNVRNVIANFVPLESLSVNLVGSGRVTSSPGIIFCSPYCSDLFPMGTVVTLTASPWPLWLLSYWSGCDVPSGYICTVTVNSNRTVTAVFVQSNSMTVSVSGNGNISSTDGYIKCPSVCTHNYPPTAQVTLIPTAAQNWTFTGWSGACTGTGSCVVSMNQARSVGATFTPVYPLSVVVTGSGTITSSDGNINCGNACTFTYLSGTTVTLTATPAANWAFTGWTGCDTVNANACTVKMNSARNVSATFTPLYPLSVAETGPGTVTSTDTYINCGASCSHVYLSGTLITLNATPAQNAVLTQWNGCDHVTGNVCTVSMYAARNVSATFKVIYPLTVFSSGNGVVFSGDGSINCGSACSAYYPAGTVLALTAMPAVGWSFSEWTNCPSPVGNVCTVTINAPTAVSAAFASAAVTFTSLTFAPPMARPGTISIGTLVLGAPAPNGGVVVSLASNEPAIVHVPSQLFIPGGATSVTFAARIIGVRPVTATITATCGSASISADLVVTWGSGKPLIFLNAPAPGASLLSGHAYNVDANKIKVVIYVLTNQWYVQPLANAPFTDISANGSWSSYTNSWQSIVALLVDPNIYIPAPTKITNPALDPGVLAWTMYPSGPVSFNFSGYTWGIKTTGQLPGDQFNPGPNYWSNDPSVVHLATDGLHFNNNQLNGNWESAEVYLTRSLGYGIYTEQVDSQLAQLDPHTVAAPLFIYESPTQELDNEYGGIVPSPYNAQFVVQPYTVPGNIVYYNTPSSSQFTTQMDWESDHVTFTAWDGWGSTWTQGTLIYQWTYTGANIPVPGNERVHINLWLLNGQAPTSGVGDQMVIHSFSYQP